MFSEALEIYDFLEIREVIIPQFHCAKRNGRRSRRASAQIDDTMFSAILGSFASLEVREVIIPNVCKKLKYPRKKIYFPVVRFFQTKICIIFNFVLFLIVVEYIDIHYILWYYWNRKKDF